MNERIEVKTVFGTLTAEPSCNPDYPGIWISITQPHPDGNGTYEQSLALIESWEDLDLAGTYVLRVGVYGNLEGEEMTHDVRIARICEENPGHIINLGTRQ